MIRIVEKCQLGQEIRQLLGHKIKLDGDDDHADFGQNDGKVKGNLVKGRAREPAERLEISGNALSRRRPNVNIGQKLQAPEYNCPSKRE